jgi:hypothetical protein
MSKARVFLFAITLMLVTPGLARAGNAIGEACWNIQGFPDIIKLAFSSNGSQLEFHGTWAANPPSAYLMNGSGNGVVFDGSFLLGGTFVNNNLAIGFQGSAVIAMECVLNFQLTGPCNSASDGPWPPTPFTAVPVPCPPGPFDPADKSGPGIGQ